LTRIRRNKNQIENKFHWLKVWIQFKDGDQSAFEEIYSEYVETLFNFGLKLTSDQGLVKDSIQDLFINLFRYNINLKKPESIEFYLFKSLKRLITKKLKKKSKLEEIDFKIFDLKFDFENEYIQNEIELQKLKQLEESLNKLSLKNRELLFYKFNSNLSNREIGDILGEKPDTVRKRISRIIQGIREDFKHSIPDIFILCCIA
jgi:RNA polymerase sigma factor (sigma-70 family)